jgi:hypothetical protein
MIWKIRHMYEIVGSTRKGAIYLDRSRNPVLPCALHLFMSVLEKHYMIFFSGPERCVHLVSLLFSIDSL